MVKRPRKSRTGFREGADVENREFDAGRYIFREKESGDIAFIVEFGTVDIFITVDGEEVPLSTAREGQMFGEMALIDDGPRMASAKARTQVSVMAISKKVFERKLETMDPFTRNLVKVLTEYIRSTADAFAEYTRKKDSERPAPE